MRMAVIGIVCLTLIGCGEKAANPAKNPAAANEAGRGETTDGSSPDAHVATMPSAILGVRNFAKVSPVLYRGEQPSLGGVAELKKMGIKTVVDLRWLHDDEHLMTGTGLRYFRIYGKPWHPEDEDMAAFLKIVEDPTNQPVFVHCQHGADRTGCAVAVYRMVEQNWSAKEAIDEMNHFHFHAIFTEIPSYLNHLDVNAMRVKVKAANDADVRVVN